MTTQEIQTRLQKFHIYPDELISVERASAAALPDPILADLRLALDRLHQYFISTTNLTIDQIFLFASFSNEDLDEIYCNTLEYGPDYYLEFEPVMDSDESL